MFDNNPEGKYCEKILMERTLFLKRLAGQIKFGEGIMMIMDNKDKVEELLSKMTVLEKVGQLNQCGNSIYNEDYKIGWDLLRKGMIGSFLGIADVAKANELQKVSVEETRLGIPLLLGFDVIHGFITMFPTPWTESFSWEPELAKKTAEAFSKEAALNGINWIYAPMIDVARDSRWGRIVEGAGEDTLLVSDFAKARVKGIQGEDLSDGEHAAACAKHFVAYGAAIAGRDYNSVDISEQSLYEVYLPPFKAAVEAGVESIMTAFHDLNGEPCTGSYDLITKKLKEEMGFKGIVISDAGATEQLKTHGFAENYGEVAKTAINAGLDVEMCFGIFTYQEHLVKLVENNEVSMERLDDAVRRVLNLKYKLGLFDNPYKNIEIAKKAVRTQEHIKLAYESAVKSIVLLKNDNHILPIKEQSSICVIGPFADNACEMLGSWSALGREEDCISPYKGILKYCNAYLINGCNMDDDNDNEFEKIDEVVKKSDTVVVFIGEPRKMNGESKSRTSNVIPGQQLNLLKYARERFKNVISVVIAGRPIVLTEVIENSDSVLFSGALGNEAGNAYADIIFGKRVPSGKLVNTFPTVVGQTPLYYNHNNTGKPPVEELWYTSKYIDTPIEPLFPFGYGLSYTDFVYSNLMINKEKFCNDDEINVSVDVKNDGDFDADEIVQLYVTDKVATRTRPVKELKAYKKVFIKKGNVEKVSLKIKVCELGFYDKSLNYVVEKGTFILSVGKNSNDVLQKEFEVI